jgi:micrococcal nuclease
VNGKLILFLISITSIGFCFVVHASSGEIDATVVVSRIIDGDTFDAASGERIRLADVDAPERGEYGYYDAKDFLTSLIDGRLVYLDIDDVYGQDKYGRWICVVYVKHNSTHYMNINKALLVEGVAVIKNYDNEFNPYAWTLYVHEEAIPEYPTFITLLLSATATSLATMIRKKRYAKYLSNFRTK